MAIPLIAVKRTTTGQMNHRIVQMYETITTINN